LRCEDRSHVCIQAHRLAQTLQQPPPFFSSRGGCGSFCDPLCGRMLLYENHQPCYENESERETTVLTKNRTRM
jgi:hypothetical protein